MTQILTPLADRIRDKNQAGRDAKHHGMHKRMCWVCQKEKPIRGGTFPTRDKNQRGSVSTEQFRCEECSVRLAAKKAAKQIEQI